MFSGWLKTSSYIVVPVEDDEQGRGGRRQRQHTLVRPQSNPDVKSQDRVRDCGPRVPRIESHHTRGGKSK